MSVAADEGVWARVIGQPAVVQELRAAIDDPAAMTHAWLFTGPPGSGRSVAARAFAAALQCPDGGDGTCHACRTVLAGTHADVNVIVPDGLSIGVNEARELVRVAGRSPSQGRWQMIIVEDADRMSESASNAVLKMIEEPPPRTVVMLCAPSLHPDDVPVTIRSRCRRGRAAHADGRPPSPTCSSAATASTRRWPPGRPRRPAGTWAGPAGWRGTRRRGWPARRCSTSRCALVSLAACMDAADDLVGAAKEETEAATEVLDGAETDALKNSLGVGARGPGGRRREPGERRASSRSWSAGRSRGPPASAATPWTARWSTSPGSTGTRWCSPRRRRTELPLNHPDRRADAVELARRLGPEGALRRIDAILDCRTALEQNVKPQIALEALTVALRLPA